MSENNAGAPGKIFRNAMNGFNRQDVTEYIEHMAQDRRRDAERYSAHIRSMDDEHAALKEEMRDLESRFAQLAGEAVELQERLDASFRHAEFLKNANESLNGELRALSAELAALKSVESGRHDETPPASVPVSTPPSHAGVRGEDSGRDEAWGHYEERLEALIAELEEMRDTVPERDRGSDGRKSGVANMIRRTRENAVGPADNLEAVRVRMMRLRSRTKDTIVGCSSLCEELLSELDAVEELLKN